MRARSWWCVAVLMAFGAAVAWGEEAASPGSTQVATCPTVLPVEEGERSIVVPTTAPFVEMPPNQTPHVASRTLTPEQEANHSLLKEKLAQRDQLQREIAVLRESTRTPEQILVRVKVLEVNLTKLRQANIDLTAQVDGQPQSVAIAALLDGRATNSAVAAPSPHFANVASVDKSGLGAIAALERQQLGKVLAEPSLVVIDGRKASFNVGGQVPIPGPSDTATSFIDYGTKLDVTATCLGNNRVRLEVRPRIAELDNSRAIDVGGIPVPAVKVREVDFGSEVEFGKSVVMSGPVQERTVATKSGWSLRKSEVTHEIALVVVVTPEIVR